MRRNISGSSPDSGQSVKLVTTGQGGALKAAGYVMSSSNGNNNRYASGIRFYDTQNTVQPNLYATNFRVKNSVTHLLLKNTSAAAVTAAPRFRPTESAGQPVIFSSVTINSFQTIELNLQPLRDANANRPDLDSVSVEIGSTSAPGSLIGALYSKNQMTNVDYDVPLRDSGVLRNSTGAYPWRLDDDYKTTVSVTNVGSKATQFSVLIHFNGGKYTLATRQLEAGQTAVYDLKQIRDNHQPDRNGNVIPMTAASGQFRWSVTRTAPSQARLIGRSEVVSRSGRVSISYSCPMCCPNNGPYVDDFPVFLVDTGAFNYFSGNGRWFDCYGDFWDTGIGWFSATSGDTSIAQVGDQQQTGAIEVQGMSAGQTSWSGTYFFSWFASDDLNCIDNSQYVGTGGEVNVRPRISDIDPDRSVVNRTVNVTIDGSGFAAGATVNVAGSGVTVSSYSVVSANQITATFVIAPNAAQGERDVTVTVNNQPTAKSFGFKFLIN